MCRHSMLVTLLLELVYAHPSVQVILDAATCEANLPASVEAFFFMKGTGSQLEEVFARKLHRAFNNKYGLEGNSEVPLLQMDLTHLDAPFVAA